MLCELTKSLGVPVKYQIDDDPEVWESNLNAGMHDTKVSFGCYFNYDFIFSS